MDQEQRMIIVEDKYYFMAIAECNYANFRAATDERSWTALHFCEVVVDKQSNKIVKCRRSIDHLLLNGLGKTIPEYEYLTETNKPKEHYLEF